MSINQSNFFKVLLIVFLCFIIYVPSLKNGFIWDDGDYLYKNPWVQKPEGLKTIWFTQQTPQYYPIVFSAFWLEHKLWGLNPFGYHSVNLILHILNAFLFFWIASKIYPRLAFISALLFAIHPIQVETVSWITERKNLLSLIFFFLAVLAYLRFDHTRKMRYYLLTVGIFVCAMLSKSIAVCFISVPVLYKWWRDGKVSWREVRLSLVFIAIGLLSAFHTLYLEYHRVGAQGRDFALTFLERFIISGRIILFYIYKIILPRDFMFFYPRWVVNTKLLWQWLFSFAVILVLCTLIMYRKRTGRGASALFIFYIISIFPALGFFNVYPMKFSFVADHFSYLSTPALFLLLCASIAFAFDKLRIKFHRIYSVSYEILKWCLFALVAIYLCSKSIALTRNYKNSFTLWSDLIRKNPAVWIAYNNLGILSSPAEAIPLYNKVIELKPDYAEAYSNRGVAHQMQGEPDQAISDFSKAIELKPDYAEAYNNRGVAYQKQGESAQALSDFSKAIELKPDYAEAYNNRGSAYQSLRKFKQAILDYTAAIQIDSHFADAYRNRGNTYYSLGAFHQAILDYTRAIEIDPNDTIAYNNRAVAYFAKQEYSKSWEDAHKAEALGYKINPQFLEKLRKATGE